MLNPSNDRLDYGQILAPPPGYELDFAVGTTYSLDLDALVGASLAMGLSEETDSVLIDNPVCLLEALRSVGDKVALFCEGGQIHMPGKVTPLYILLEKMVFSVQTKKKKRMAAYPSFHPKFWLLRFANTDGEIVYRIIILSRNLTFDRSWDVTYYMDGYENEDDSDKNEPVCDFLRFLLKQLPTDINGKQKAKAIRAMIRELPFIEFEPPEKAFSDYEFIPNGIKRAEGGYYCFDETRLFTDTFHEIAIVSPFISSDIIRDFNERNEYSSIQNTKYMLITREASLGKLQPEDVSNFSIYTMRDSVIDGESAISEEQTDVQKQDIHAKMFMFLKYSTADLYLGSLNASHNAVYGNVEFMIRLNSKRRYLNMDSLQKSLFGKDPDGTDNPFQEVTLQTAIIDEDNDKQNDLNAVIKQINRSNPTAVVVEAGDAYNIKVMFEDCDTKGYQVTLKPLLSNKTEPFKHNVLFQALDIMQLSDFYVITVSDGESTVERVLIIPTEGLPDGREKAVVTSVINNEDCFYRYIAFLLGDSTIMTALEEGDVMGNSQAAFKQPHRISALYEKMLITAAENPEKFKGVDYLLKTISDEDIIPEEFEALYRTFKRAVKLDG